MAKSFSVSRQSCGQVKNQNGSVLLLPVHDSETLAETGHGPKSRKKGRCRVIPCNAKAKKNAKGQTTQKRTDRNARGKLNLAIVYSQTNGEIASENAPSYDFISKGQVGQTTGIKWRSTP